MTSPEHLLLSTISANGTQSFLKASEAGVATSVFASRQNGLVFATQAKCVANGEEPVPENVLARLQRDGMMPSPVSIDTFLACTDLAVSSVGFDALCESLVMSHKKRTIERIAKEATIEAQERNPDEHAAELLEKLRCVAETGQPNDEPQWREVIDLAESKLREMEANKGMPQTGVIHWPWERMDRDFAPMQSGQLVIVAARTSVGKSSFMRQVSLGAARDGKHVYFVTLEVNPERVAMSMASAITRIPISGFHAHSKGDREEVYNALKAIRGFGITISSKDRTLNRIVTRARILKSQNRLDLLVVDHGLLVQDVQHASEGEKVAAIAKLTGTLKLLANELRCVCVLIWQINRESVRDGDKPPALHNLKGCGSLEEDADKVIILHRPNVNPLNDQAQPGNSLVDDVPSFFVQVSQEKGRDDGTSFLSMDLHRKTASFRQIDRTAHNIE